MAFDLEKDFSVTKYDLGVVPTSQGFLPFEGKPSTLLIEATDGEVKNGNGRWYKHDGLWVPSITTLLGNTDPEGTAALVKWKESCGEEFANQITSTAIRNGNQWHAFIEWYLLDGTPETFKKKKMQMPSDKALMVLVAAILHANVKRVLACERRVFSEKFGLCGRVDICVELMDGRFAILDAKSGRKYKTDNRLEKYALQLTFYADGCKVFTDGRDINDIIILQIVPEGVIWMASSPSLWEAKLFQKIEMFADLIEQGIVTPPSSS